MIQRVETTLLGAALFALIVACSAIVLDSPRPPRRPATAGPVCVDYGTGHTICED